MCESHINDIIRRKFTVKNASSHKKGETAIIAQLIKTFRYSYHKKYIYPYIRRKEKN